MCVPECACVCLNVCMFMYVCVLSNVRGHTVSACLYQKKRVCAYNYTCKHVKAGVCMLVLLDRSDSVCSCVSEHCVCALWGLYQVSGDSGRKQGGRCYEQIIDTERKK